MLALPTAVPAESEGSSWFPIPAGLTSLRGKTVNNNYYTPQGAGGTVLHNVNMLTGQPAYSVPIANISMGKTSFPIGFSYSGSVRQAASADNERGPSSWIGFGWSFSAPFVAVNNKGTVAKDDDNFVCNLGPYGGGQLLQNSSGTFFLATNPAVKIQSTTDASGLISAWEFKFPDGVRMKFGSSFSGDLAERYMVRFGGAFVSSPFPASGGAKFIYRWDLSVMDSRPLGSSLLDRLEFRYDRVNIDITPSGNGGTGSSYTRESYLKEIVAVNHLGKEVEKYKFITANKGTDEYSTATAERSLNQALFESKRLSSIEWTVEATPAIQRNITLFSFTANPSPYKKRFLDSLLVEYRNSIGAMVNDPERNWKFSYDAGNYYGLKTMARGLSKQEYFYDQPNYANTPWANRTRQEAWPRKLKSSATTDVVLPAASTVKTDWETQTQCTERFCLVSATQRLPTDNMYLEVWKNNGNYFTLAKLDGADFRIHVSSIYPKSIQLIPWNGNFILADTRARTFTLYEWDGEMFKANTNVLKRWKGTTLKNVLPYATASTAPQRFVLGGDYFLVVDEGFRDACTDTDPIVSGSAKVYVVRKSLAKQRFADLNENECDAPITCVNDVANYGESYAGSANRCLEYNSTNIFVSASPTMFHVVHKPTNIVLSFVQNSDGNSFLPIGSKYSHSADGSDATHRNNWIHIITEPIQSGNDYFLITTNPPGQLEGRINVMHYNGGTVSCLNQTAYPNITGPGAVKTWVGGDYFLTYVPALNSVGTLNLTRKTVQTSGGVPNGMTFNRFQVATGFDVSKQYQVSTHPYAFTFEGYPNGSLNDGYVSKPPVVSGTNYMASIYEYNPGLLTSTGVPFRDVSSMFRDGNNRNYFDVSFASGDNLVVAKSCVSSTNTACIGAAGDNIQYVSAQIFPEYPAPNMPFFANIQNVFQSWTANASYNFNQFRMSAANRVAALSMLNVNSSRAEFRTLQNMGEGFTQNPWQFGAANGTGKFPFVKTFKSYSALTGSSRGNWTQYGFTYTPGPNSLVLTDPEFNTHTQNFIFPGSSVTTYKGSETMTVPVAQVMETVKHVFDDSSAPVSEASLDQVGLRIQSRTHDVDGALGAESIKDEASRLDLEYYPPQTETGWPLKLSMSHLKKTTQIVWAANRSHQTQITSYHKYDADNGQPLFTKSKAAGKWYLNQTLFQKTGENRSLPIGSYAFRFDTEPPDATLNAWSDPTLIYNLDNADAKTVSAAKTEYDATFPFLVSKTRGWRDADPTLTDEELKIGDDPIYANAANWEDHDIVEKRSATGLPLQIRHALSETNGLNRYTSYFYEGLAPFLIGTVENAVWDEAAILSGENQLNGSMDPEGRWTLTTGTAATSWSDKAHTGRWGIKITDNPGVFTKVKLRGGSTLTNDYVISAWVLAETANKPIITISRYQKNGSAPLETFPISDPTGQTFSANKWQRYEKRLTVAQLKGSQNIFGTLNSGDYLLITLGTGSTTGDGRKVHLDDIVCRPANSVYSLTGFDKWHRPIHATNNENFTRSFEYDVFGRATGARDDRFRMYSEQSAHAVGEND